MSAQPDEGGDAGARDESMQNVDEVELAQSESTIDGFGTKLKKFLGVGKDDSSYTYKAKITPASDSEHPSSLASITDVTPLPKSTSEGSNKSQTQDSSSIQTIYQDKGTAMLSGNLETYTLIKGDNQIPSSGNGKKSSTLQGGETSLELNLPYVVSPDDNTSKPGLALIITGQKFAKGIGGYRIGAEKDLNNMFEVFYHLNFEIKWEPFVNRTTQDLKNELIKCAEDSSLEEKNCLVIVISSHGGEIKLGSPYRPEDIPHDINVYGHAVTTFDGMIPTTEILEIFDEDHCPYMEGKPKLMFIQACRVRNDVIKVDQGFEVEVIEKTDPSQTASFFEESTMDVRHKMETSDDTLEPIQDIMSMKNMLLTPCQEDFMVVFASTSEYVGWSDSSGGVLLTAMYNVFKKKIERKEEIDLLPTMTEVCNKMTEYQSNISDSRYDKSKSVMSLLHMLGEEIIFKPRYSEK